MLTRLQAAGYEIKPGKYVSCRAPGQERFTRLKTLGADYTEEAIRERIAGRRAKAAKAPREQRGVSLLIDIENSIKAAQSKGYEQWAKIHNLKQAAKTMNFLTEHKIEQYADLVSRIEEMAAESGQAADALKDAEKRLADMAVLIKNVSTYQKTKPVYDAYRKARNREKYRAGQEQAIILHEAAARSLKAAGIAKLPNLAALQSEYEALQAQKEALYADYGKLKKKVREYDIIKQNIDSILQADRQTGRAKGTGRGRGEQNPRRCAMIGLSKSRGALSMENQKMPEYETIRAAVAGEKWAVEKVVECYKDEIDRLSTVAVRQPDGSTKQEINEDMRQSITKKLIEADRKSVV